MKKTILCAAAAVFGLWAGAQEIIPVNYNGIVKKSDEKVVLDAGAKYNAPKKLASLDDTTLWGYYLGDLNDGDVSAVGVETTATYYVGYFVSGSGVLKGSSINGFNVPVYSTNMANVSVWISNDLETNLVSKNVDASTLHDGFNAVALDEPFAIPEAGVFVGVKFSVTRATTEADQYPVLISSSDSPANMSLLMRYVIPGEDSGWADYTAMFSAQFTMQLFCSNLTLASRNVHFSSVRSASTLPGEEVVVPAKISSDSGDAINSIDYVVEINGEKTSKHIDLTTPIAPGFSKTADVEISFTAPENYGAYTAKISIEKANGIDNAASDSFIEVKNKVLTKVVARKTVVEEFTGTACGWCPRGWLGMETLKETKENFIGLAFHQYNSSDPMYIDSYYSVAALGISGAPGCSVDRKVLGIDPYYGESEEPFGIIDTFDYCNSLLPDVAVSATAEYNSDKTKVDIATEVEYLTEGDTYTVVYVLTADGLSGTTSAWKQGNYYYSYSPVQVGDENLSIFCRGGEYGSSSIALTFNDVVIASSYSRLGVNMGGKLSGEVKPGATATGSYSATMPSKATLKNAIDYEKVYAVVLVVASDGTIANAARVRVGGEDEGGVANVATDAEAVEVARYNLAGQALTEPVKGINIVRYSNGTTAKVIVR